MKPKKMKRLRKMTIADLDVTKMKKANGGVEPWPCLTAVVMGGCIQVTACLHYQCTVIMPWC